MRRFKEMLKQVQHDNCHDIVAGSIAWKNKRELLMEDYFVYIMASRSKVLYIGVTSDLEKRVWEHKHKAKGGFTTKYNVNRLVFLEEFGDINEAIAREKQLKNWRRQWKINLIESSNPDWKDLSIDPETSSG